MYAAEIDITACVLMQHVYVRTQHPPQDFSYTFFCIRTKVLAEIALDTPQAPVEAELDEEPVEHSWPRRTWGVTQFRSKPNFHQ
jgi:hypothetical protein